jgi:uncharacterized protein (DUF58 family)
MTRGRIAYAALLAALFILHIMLVDYISYYIILLFLFLPLASILIAFAFCRDSVVEMRVTSARSQGASAMSTAAKGDTAKLELRVKNPSFIQVRTRIDLVVRNELAGDEKKETIIVPATSDGGIFEQSASFGLPGKISFRVCGTGVYDPLGLFCLKTKRANARSRSLVVFPDAPPIAGVAWDSPVSRDVENDGLMKGVKGDDPSELYDIREYRPGDLISRVHWKLSHKTGRLMVKEHGRVVCGDALIMLDLNSGRAEADALLTALASVSAGLSRAGTAHDIEWYSARGNRVSTNHVASEKDGAEAMSSILSEGGLQSEPYVMRGRRATAGRNPYSKIVYMCSSSGLSDGELPMFAKRISGSGVSVLLVSDEGSKIDALAEGTGIEANILCVRPADTMAVLRESAL